VLYEYYLLVSYYTAFAVDNKCVLMMQQMHWYNGYNRQLATISILYQVKPYGERFKASLMQNEQIIWQNG
jgi:hypothetical protein